MFSDGSMRRRLPGAALRSGPPRALIVARDGEAEKLNLTEASRLTANAQLANREGAGAAT